MARLTIEVPAPLRARAGSAWLEALPGRVEVLCQRWSLTLGEPFLTATGSFVTRVATPDGPAVLKVALPNPVSRNQIRFLAAAAGVGYARVLAADESEDALLLEALGPSVAEAGLAPEEQLARIAETLLLAWTVPPLAGANASRAAGKAVGLGMLARETWERLGRPCSAAAVDLAQRCAASRTAEFGELVTAHGDPHPGNALLRLDATGCAFVDADGELGERAYDLGVAIRDWSFQLAAAPDPGALLQAYATLLAEQTGEDATAIWEWGYLERVATGLYALDHGLPEFGTRLLAVADALAG